MDGLPGSVQCHFCSQSRPQYSCPRCQAAYCSLRCYRSQGHVDCSEDFYKQCVTDELRATANVDANVKERMIHSLKALHEQDQQAVDDDDLDSDDEEDLAKRLEGIDLDAPEAVWERLTAQEQQEFEQMVQSGAIEKLLPDCKPFWEQYEEKKFVQDISDSPPPSPAFQANCPNLEESITAFENIYKGEPSPSVKFALLNILYAYCHVFRMCLGDLLDDAVSNARHMLQISLALRGGAADFGGADSAMDAARAQATLAPELALPPKAASSLNRDVWKIVRGPGGNLREHRNYYILAALSHVKRVLSAAVGASKKTPKSGFDRSLARRAVKKVDFFLSWTVKYGQEYDLFR